MTCIVGLVDNGVVYMGGDSLAVIGWQVTSNSTVKVFRKGGYLIGCSGQLRSAQVLEHGLKMPPLDPPPPGISLMEHLVIDGTKAIRNCLSDNNCLKKSTEGIETSQLTMLVAYKDQLCRIDHDFCITPKERFGAIGGGEEFAIGYLEATGQSYYAPVYRIQTALETAEKFNIGVRSPFTILATNGESYE